MAINTLAAATIFQQQLDKIAVQDAVTGWMDANAGQVKYTVVQRLRFRKCRFRAWEIMTVTMATSREA